MNPRIISIQQAGELPGCRFYHDATKYTALETSATEGLLTISNSTIPHPTLRCGKYDFTNELCFKRTFTEQAIQGIIRGNNSEINEFTDYQLLIAAPYSNVTPAGIKLLSARRLNVSFETLVAEQLATIPAYDLTLDGVAPNHAIVFRPTT